MEEKKILLIFSNLLTNFKLHKDSPNTGSLNWVWIDRLSGGLLSQYFRSSHSFNSKQQGSLIWISSSHKRWKHIFVLSENNEKDLSEIEKCVSESSSFACEWVGKTHYDLTKKLKKLFRSHELIQEPDPWSEDL